MDHNLISNKELIEMVSPSHCKYYPSGKEVLVSRVAIL